MVKINQPIPSDKSKYLIKRALQRGANIHDIKLMDLWFKINPDVHEEQWWKDFNSFKLVGTGPLLDTILSKDMVPVGLEVK